MPSLRSSRPIGHDHYRNVRQSDPQIQHSQLDNWAADLRHRLPTAERFSATKGYGNVHGRCQDHSGLIPATLITLAHFAVSSAMCFLKSADEPASAMAPRSTSRALKLGLASAALISRLSVSMMSGGVFLGAPIPVQPLAS